MGKHQQLDAAAYIGKMRARVERSTWGLTVRSCQMVYRLVMCILRASCPCGGWDKSFGFSMTVMCKLWHIYIHREWDGRCARGQRFPLHGVGRWDYVRIRVLCATRELMCTGGWELSGLWTRGYTMVGLGECWVETGSAFFDYVSLCSRVSRNHASAAGFY